MPSAIQAAAIKRCTFEGKPIPFIFFKVRSDWIYILSRDPIKEYSPDLTLVSMCIASKIFNPERYQLLLTIFMEQYVTSGDPTKVLEGFLSVFTTGKFSNSAGSYDAASFKDTSAFIAVSEMQDISRMLGVESVSLWNAILLKKRILVTADNLPKLQAVLRTLPQFVWHRQDWSVLRPIVDAEEEHMDDLKASGVYIAGTLDPSLASRADMFDVVFSVSDRRVTILEHAQMDMRMCSSHRDVAQIFAEESGLTSDQDIIKALAAKTSQVVKLLQAVAAENGKVTEEAIRSRSSNEATQQWLYRVAMAEGLI